MVLQRLRCSKTFFSAMILFSNRPISFSTINTAAMPAMSAQYLGPRAMYHSSFSSRIADPRSRPSVLRCHLLAASPLAYSSYRRAGRNCLPRIYAALSTAPTIERETKDEETAPLGPTTPVVLTVRNMKCGGCSAAVKRMLLQQPGIASAAVNLLTETAVVQVVGDRPEEVAEHAAAAVGAKGFPSELRKPDEDDLDSAAAAINERKAEELKQS